MDAVVMGQCFCKVGDSHALMGDFRPGAGDFRASMGDSGPEQARFLRAPMDDSGPEQAPQRTTPPRLFIHPKTYNSIYSIFNNRVP